MKFAIFSWISIGLFVLISFLFFIYVHFPRYLPFILFFLFTFLFLFFVSFSSRSSSSWYKVLTVILPPLHSSLLDFLIRLPPTTALLITHSEVFLWIEKPEQFSASGFILSKTPFSLAFNPHLKKKSESSDLLIFPDSQVSLLLLKNEAFHLCMIKKGKISSYVTFSELPRNISIHLLSLLSERIPVHSTHVITYPLLTSTMPSITVGQSLLPQSFSISLPLSIIEYNVGVFGNTGSGKTTLTSQVIQQLSSLGWSIVILDLKGEYSSLLSNCPSTVVDFVSDNYVFFVGSTFEQLKRLLYDLFNDSNTPLTPAMGSLLFSILDNILQNDGNLSMISRLLRPYLTADDFYSSSAWALLSRFNILFPPLLQNKISFTTCASCSVFERGGILIFDISKLNSLISTLPSLQFVSGLIISSLYEYTLFQNTPWLLVIEESTILNLTKAAMPILSQVALLGRSRGLNLWLIGQNASSLSPSILTNLSTLFLFQNRSSTTLKELQLSPELIKLSSSLPKHVGLCISSEHSIPFLFRTFPPTPTKPFQHSISNPLDEFLDEELKKVA